VVLVALRVVLLIRVTEASVKLATRILCAARSTASQNALRPVGAVAGTWPQPE